MFQSILQMTDATLSIKEAIICTVVSILLGFVISCVYMVKGSYSKNFIITLVLLPTLVQVVIMMVNGNLGTGIAVMGAFSLVRFRSLPGTSKEISAIFFAMVIGLATGTGYLTFAIFVTVIICVVMYLLFQTKFGEMKNLGKQLKIVIPENLDYTEIFDDLFTLFTVSYTLQNVKTINMGSMYELQYQIVLKDEKSEKEFIDALRCRNGNLTINCGRKIITESEL